VFGDDSGAVVAAEESVAVETVAPASLAAGTPASQARRTVGLVIAEALRAAGVRYAFTVPGESFLGLLEGLTAVGIRVVATRHEGAAAFMAEAHGQLTGRPAACIGTRAVGASNLAIGIHTAFADSTPMFVIVGGVERSSRGREAFQEVDLVRTFGNLAKWSSELTDAGDVAATMGQAIRQALSGRPGPVLLGIPEDLLDEEVQAGVGNEVSRPPRQPGATDDDVRAVLQLLASAERPVILAGGGVLRARCSNDLVRFADLLHVPVIGGWRRGDVIPNDHPLYLGMAGLGAPPTVRERLAGADALLVLGCRLNELTSYRWTIPTAGTRWAHVDTAPVRPSPELSAADLVIEADARLFLRAAISRLERAVLHAGLVQARDEANRADRTSWEAAVVVDHVPWTGPGIHPGRVVATLHQVLPETSILTTDTGSFAGWASRGFRFRRPGTYLGPTSGAMGYGLPAAIAAALVHPDRPVVALIGDGGLGMTLAELETAVREGARVIPIVFDNQGYGLIRGFQDRRPEGEAIATDLGPIDFVAIARACGAQGIRVETDADFEPALREALAASGPTLIHLAVDPSWGTIEQATRRAAES
jgi:acetolactate synthase-1/2/3 large subunit